MQLWWEVIKMEKANMQRMEAPQAIARVCFGYDQCLMCHFLYPEVRQLLSLDSIISLHTLLNRTQRRVEASTSSNAIQPVAKPTNP